MALLPADQALLLKAFEAENGSHDPARKVGVVISDRQGNILGVGSNRPPNALGLNRSESVKRIKKDSSWKYFVLEHAERNAIANAIAAGNRLEGSVIYGTLFPCAACARAIAEAGITHAVFPEPDLTDPRNEKWLPDFRYASEIFALAGIELKFYQSEEVNRSAESQQVRAVRLKE